MPRLPVLALLALLSRTVDAQAPRLELDHFLVMVSPGARAEIEALRAAGITVAPRVTRHDGQGTASMSAVFANAYLELLFGCARGERRDLRPLLPLVIVR